MTLSKKQIKSIEATIKRSLSKRFATYDPEPSAMPFHTRLLGKDRLALYAFIHSLNTNFGTSIFEPAKVDLYLESNDGEIYLIDIKTAKPNKGNFKEFKRTLLEWSAIVLADNPNAKINTLIAIPYNPYEPKPYSRWTMAGMLDLAKELKVAEEFWDFLGGDGAYNDLLGWCV